MVAEALTARVNDKKKQWAKDQERQRWRKDHKSLATNSPVAKHGMMS